jgi:hypothetical protein
LRGTECQQDQHRPDDEHDLTTVGAVLAGQDVDLPVF